MVEFFTLLLILAFCRLEGVQEAQKVLESIRQVEPTTETDLLNLMIELCGDKWLTVPIDVSIYTQRIDSFDIQRPIHQTHRQSTASLYPTV